MAATFKKLKVGTKLSETQYYNVEKIVGDKVQLKNDFGEPIVVDSKYVEKCLTSSEEYTTEKTMSRTDIINLFISSPSVALQVNYNKKVDEKEVQKQLNALYPNKGGKILSQAEYEKAVKAALKDALTGEERTMVGRHYGKIDEFGRIKFIDMEADGGYDEVKDTDSRQRLVDPRTINWLILRGVKYKAK